MEFTNNQCSGKLSEAHTLVLNQSLSVAGLMSLNCAVELGIADLIHSHGGPMPLSELARSIPIPPEKSRSLRRLMRLLVCLGVFEAQHDESKTAYLLTPFSELLLTKGTNMSPFIRLISEPTFLKPWFHMGDWFKREGSTPFEVAHDGKGIWDITKERPELNGMFNDAMSCNTSSVMKGIVTECSQVFRGLKSLVDVGGGTGASARMIAEAFPDLKCSVFDLPHVVATFPESKLVDAVGGNMFHDCIPPANAIFLKSILHDWSDEDCVKILKQCKQAIPTKEEGGKVIIVDLVVNTSNPKIAETHLYFDAFMMIFGGMEREEHQWRNIFKIAGFCDYKISSIPSVYSIIEVYP